jgi:site-specific recombinase XerD
MIKLPWQITRQMFLSEDEIDGLLRHLSRQVRRAERDSVAPHVDEVIIRSLLFSGLRNSEFCGLTLANTIVGTSESVFLVRGTPREDRTVYVPAELSGLIRRFVAKIRPHCLPAGAPSNDLSMPLVLNERGRPYERTGLYRRVVRILTEAGLKERASVQLLRHTYGYLAYKRSHGNLLFAQRQLGHAHPSVTSIYAQFVEESYADLADGLVDRGSKRPSKRRLPRRKRVNRSKGE